MSTFEDRELVELHNQGQKIFGVIHRPVQPRPKFLGIIHRPPVQQKKVPAVLMCHGFAGNKVGKYRIYVYLAERLCKAGILTMRFDFRGSGDSEGDITDMTLAGQLSDARLAMEYLLNDPQVDTNRIGVFGRSLGGVIAVLTAHEFRQIKSIGLWAPAFSGKQWLDLWSRAQHPDIPDEEKRKLQRFDGSACSEAFLREFFGLQIEKELASLDAIPLLHIHGAEDEHVHVTHADDYLRCREHAKGETKMLRLPHTDHEFSDFDERFFAIDETWKWFKKTL